MRSDARKRNDSLDEFEYTLTRRALRQIKAEAWDEGWAALADRIDAAIRFIGPDHITPSGERVLRSILRGRE